MPKELNCSVTVMPIREEEYVEVGFIRRGPDDTFAGMLVAPGGKVQDTDGELTDGVMYYSVEYAAIREFEEEVGVRLQKEKLFYFCSLSLPNGRVVISMYTELDTCQQSDKLLYLSPMEIAKHEDFAPGMKQEALALLESLGVDW